MLTKLHAVVLASSLALLLSATSCSTHHRLYDGEPRPLDEVALLHGSSASGDVSHSMIDEVLEPKRFLDCWHLQVRIARVDGKTVWQLDWNESYAEALPGHHKMLAQIHYQDDTVEIGGVVLLVPETHLIFDAEAGHEYVVKADLDEAVGRDLARDVRRQWEFHNRVHFPGTLPAHKHKGPPSRSVSSLLNDGSLRVWIEDKATGKVVAGKRRP